MYVIAWCKRHTQCINAVHAVAVQGLEVTTFFSAKSSNQVVMENRCQFKFSSAFLSPAHYKAEINLNSVTIGL